MSFADAARRYFPCGLEQFAGIQVFGPVMVSKAQEKIGRGKGRSFVAFVRL